MRLFAPSSSLPLDGGRLQAVIDKLLDSQQK